MLDLVSATPPPLALHLLPLAPAIHCVRRTVDVLCWSSPWEESLLVLALWWSLCLFADLVLQFFLPVAVLFVFALRQFSAPAPPAPAPPPPLPATEHTVHVLIDDLAVIHAALPSGGALPRLSPAVIRLAALVYLPYLVLTYLVPLRICVAVAGTLFLVHRARWVRNARAALARSAHLRHAFAALSSPPPEYAPAEHPSVPGDGDPSAPCPSPPLRFLFTVYENQRWWVGLDWTAALLPGERPSWCSASQLPLPPPSTFSLPSSTTSYVPVGKHGRARRMARWTWEEPEWRVVVRKDGQDGLWRVEKSPPKDKDVFDDSSAAARMFRAARGNKDNGSPEREKRTPPEHLQDPSIAPAHEDDIITDPEGWVYGDNKWEGASSKGGMGKYTRYRRWTRIALLTETVELVGPGEFGVVRDSDAFSVSSTVNTSSMVTAGAASPTTSSFSDWESTGSAPEHKEFSGGRGILRQRSKPATGGSGH